MRRFSFGVRLMVVAAAISAVVIAVTAGGAGAGGSATLNLQLFPSSLLPNGTGAALATFTNGGSSTVNHVVVNVTLPSGFRFDSADSSTYCSANPIKPVCNIIPTRRKP